MREWTPPEQNHGKTLGQAGPRIAPGDVGSFVQEHGFPLRPAPRSRGRFGQNDLRTPNADDHRHRSGGRDKHVGKPAQSKLDSEPSLQFISPKVRSPRLADHEMPLFPECPRQSKYAERYAERPE